ncbi:hypothetical protein ACFRKE_09680 [Kitasatospora indigofera]|uniref:hypothetical protein n=1 Tax=Kitasatospora indigofera TaxID=67307 RepID=UPI00368DCC7C
MTRTGFYPKKHRDSTTRPGPYQHLAEEFERRLKTLQDAGEIVDPRDAQIARLKADNADLRGRVARRDQRIAELVEFQTLALSRLAAQHHEIHRLRGALANAGNVRPIR